MPHEAIDLAALREGLADTTGRQYWRSLEELAETEAFTTFLQREFPQGASEMKDPLTRRRFLKLMAASFGLAGLSACAQQPASFQQVVPYVNPPEGVVPGIAQFYATAMPLAGYGLGVLARSDEGRPTKVDGNPDHPANLGASDVFMQASVLGVYDPDRSQTVLNQGRASTWEAFLPAVQAALQPLHGNGGAGLHVLTESVSSPTLVAQMQQLRQIFPQAQWHSYDPASTGGAQAGAQMAFGRDVQTIYNFKAAQRVLALDSDFMLFGPGSVRYARDFVAGRLVRDSSIQNVNRLYVLESTPTITGAAADHRLPLRASDIEAAARVVAQRLGVDAGAAASLPASVPQKWLDALVTDLQQHRGASIVIAGDTQPPVVHALAHAMNDVLGNVGTTVRYTEPVLANVGDQVEALRGLTQAMAGGQVQSLIIMHSNPAYSAPADLAFADALQQVSFSAHLGLYYDETARAAHWHIPAAHYLESWSDVRAYEGTVSIIQPLIDPIYGGKTAHELVSALLGQNAASHDIVRRFWQQQRGAGDFAAWWLATLQKGVVADTVAQPIQVNLQPITAPPNFAAQSSANGAAGASGMELTFRLDPTIWDGRFANNGWLQEQAKPLTSITWDNVALVSPADAERLTLQSGDLVDLNFRGRSVRAPVWVMPGQPDGSINVTLGYGRRNAGQIGDGLGFNAYALRPADALWFGSGLEIAKTGQRYDLASVQNHFSMDGHDFVRTATLDVYRQNPGFVEKDTPPRKPFPSLYPEYDYANTEAWGMVIDTTACIGCNACSMACQAENNIAVVGKDQVLMGREMQWIKVDTYFAGGVENPETHFQPRPCMHCEKAPCELVCPVEATLHDYQGLNLMVYNRCVGTRYCSNNCPYKVRRFNFLQYARPDVPVLQLVNNPNVTVRARGVMEKCTYCVQRIASVRATADIENRAIQEGEVVTACQQACPTQAIVFGNINDPNSQVAKLKALPSNYGLLEELNTQPRTSYLPDISNSNPEI